MSQGVVLNQSMVGSIHTAAKLASSGITDLPVSAVPAAQSVAPVLPALRQASQLAASAGVASTLSQDVGEPGRLVSCVADAPRGAQGSDAAELVTGADIARDPNIGAKVAALALQVHNLRETGVEAKAKASAAGRKRRTAASEFDLEDSGAELSQLGSAVSQMTQCVTSLLAQKQRNGQRKEQLMELELRERQLALEERELALAERKRRLAVDEASARRMTATGLEGQASDMNTA